MTEEGKKNKKEEEEEEQEEEGGQGGGRGGRVYLPTVSGWSRGSFEARVPQLRRLSPSCFCLYRDSPHHCGAGTVLLLGN